MLVLDFLRMEKSGVGGREVAFNQAKVPDIQTYCSLRTITKLLN